MPLQVIDMNILGLMKLKGTMQFPLAGSQNYEDFQKESSFTGDFRYNHSRVTIFSKPRQYRFFVGLVDTIGNLVDETEYKIDEPLTKDELTQVIKQMIHEQLYEVEENQEINLAKSYVRIEL